MLGYAASISCLCLCYSSLFVIITASGLEPVISLRARTLENSHGSRSLDLDIPYIRRDAYFALPTPAAFQKRATLPEGTRRLIRSYRRESKKLRRANAMYQTHLQRLSGDDVRSINPSRIRKASSAVQDSSVVSPMQVPDRFIPDRIRVGREPTELRRSGMEAAVRELRTAWDEMIGEALAVQRTKGSLRTRLAVLEREQRHAGKEVATRRRSGAGKGGHGVGKDSSNDSSINASARS